jgi:hypothetical protein
MRYIFKGDVNRDGNVDRIDAVLILKYVAGIINKPYEYIEDADVIEDGKVQASDARAILQHEAGSRIIDDYYEI